MKLFTKTQQEKENIISNAKIHTLKTDRVGLWTKGRLVRHTYEGETYLEKKCFLIQQILIILLDGNELKMTVDRRRLKDSEVDELIKNEGYPGRQDFIDLFLNAKGLNMWAGKIIHWTRLKY